MTESTCADKIICLAEEDFEFFRTLEGEPVAASRNGQLGVIPLTNSDATLRRHLLLAYREQYGTFASPAALRLAIDYLLAMAHSADHRAVHLRTALVDGNIIVDLGRDDGKVAIITADGWRIEEQSPTYFRRNDLISEMPEPDEAGTLDDLHAALQVPDEVSAEIIGWIAAVFLDGRSTPLLHIAGEAGSGKTMLAKRLIALVNPSPVPVQGEPATAEQWTRLLASSKAIALDNVSRIDRGVSDFLCRAVTGDGQVKRRLYTDTDLVVTRYRRSIILTGIDVGKIEPDLMDRMLFVRLKRIDAGNRRTETEIMREFKELRPKALGAVFNLLVKVIDKLPKIKLRELPRMADYAEVLAAIDASLATERLHLDAFINNGEDIIGEVIDGDDVAQLLIGFMAKRDEWRGTNGELLTELKARSAGRSSDLPRRPRALRQRLTRLAPVLRSIGLAIEFGPGEGSSKTRRVMTIRKDRVVRSSCVTPSTPSTPSRSSARRRRTGPSANGLSPVAVVSQRVPKAGRN